MPDSTGASEPVSVQAFFEPESKTMMSPESIDRYRQQLLERREVLRAEASDGAQRRVGEDRFSAIASEVPDAGDASVAAEQADLRNAQLSRDVGELLAIERALVRLDDGSYGMCQGCAERIVAERLLAVPYARHCVPCASRG